MYILCERFCNEYRRVFRTGEILVTKEDIYLLAQDEVEKAATKMYHLFSDTLKLSRIGRIANPPEDVPFGEIVRKHWSRPLVK